MSLPQRPDTIPGYNHPENNSVTQKGTSIYKTFTEGKKVKKNEKFGSTQIGVNYTKAGKNIDEKEEVCPVCDKPPVVICNCIYSDKKCKDGHIWYTDRGGKIKTGNPHK